MRVGLDHAAVDQDGARAHGFDFIELVRGDQDRLVGGHARDERAHRLLLVGIEAVGGFIQDQHGGVVDDGAGERNAAAIAFRERLDRLGRARR